MKRMINMNQHQLAEMIMKEAKRYAHKETKSCDKSELESYLISKVWAYIADKESYQNIRGIRQCIKSHGLNWFKKRKRINHREIVWSRFDRNGYGNRTESYISFIDVNRPENFEEIVIPSVMMDEFLSRVNVKQLNIISLTLDGYSVNEIAEELNIHRNTVRNTFKQIKELALDFGIEEI